MLLDCISKIELKNLIKHELKKQYVEVIRDGNNF